MLSSIAAMTAGISLARPAVASAPTPGRDSASASKGVGTVAADTISLSAKAQKLLTVSADFAEFETQFIASQVSAQAGKDSLAQSCKGGPAAFWRSGADEFAVVSKEFPDTRYLIAFVSGNVIWSDVVDVAAFVKLQPNKEGQ